MSVYIFSEVQTKNGRADAIIIYEDDIYCLEFKLNKSAADAMDQLTKKDYIERFKHTNKHLHHIGFNFSSDKQEVEEVLWEEVG